MPERATTRLYLIRHARTMPTGPDAAAWPLSPDGEAEARELARADFWEDIDALYSSPEPKALETVRPAAGRYGLEIRADERLREARRPAEWLDDYAGAVRRYLERAETPENWEPAPDAEERMRTAVRAVERAHPGRRVAICSHGLALALFLSAFERPPGGPFALWSGIGFGEVAVVEGGAVLLPFGEPRRAGLTVRRVDAGDFAAVSALLGELGRPEVTEERREAAQAVFERHMASPEVESLLALRDGRPVGFISLHIRERLNQVTPEAWAPDLIMTESERGGRAARMLFRRAVEIARERGCHRLVLESGRARARAHRIYAREGMADTGKVFGMDLEGG